LNWTGWSQIQDLLSATGLADRARSVPLLIMIDGHGASNVMHSQSPLPTRPCTKLG
jgi:hypothetical protein